MQQSVAIPKFPNTGDFAKEVRGVAELYFKKNNLEKTGDWRLYSKTIVLFLSYVALYYFIVFSQSPFWAKFPACVMLGSVTAGIGFNVMHDAIHGSYSKSKSWNNFWGLSLNFLGGNNVLWRTKHNVIHHTNTNIDVYDEDIEGQPLFRFHPNQKWMLIHKYQHHLWYWTIGYGLLYFAWIWHNDYKKYFTKKILYKSVVFSGKEHVIFWVSKLFYISYAVVIPIIFVGFWWWLVGYLVVVGYCSYRIAIVFQLAHVVEGVDTPTIFTNDSDFLKHQIATTANFATQSKWLYWRLGGLNFQIEHHLFPGVSHIHYPELHKIIKPLCEKWGIRYTEYPTMASAIKSHVAQLKKLGRKP